ncbi:hypothetical protein ES703_63105 [subsurface metagenome]
MGALLGIVGLGVVGLLGVLILAATGVPLEVPEEVPPEEIPPPEEEEVIDATLRSGYAWWEGLTDWQRVSDRWPNEWPADTDVTFAWKIKNTGNVGAYFQVYMLNPGEWLYIEPDDEIEVFEEFHTPAVPVTPGYSYYRINILGRKLTGERIGAVWTSDEFEITYS